MSQQLRPPLPAPLRVKNRLFWDKNLEKRFLSAAPSYEHSLERTGTTSLLHHAAFTPLPTGAPSFPWGAELTCSGKRVLAAEVQSQDAEQQAWNRGGRLRPPHLPEEPPQQQEQLIRETPNPAPPASLEQGGGHIPWGRRGEPHGHT